MEKRGAKISGIMQEMHSGRLPHHHATSDFCCKGTFTVLPLNFVTVTK